MKDETLLETDTFYILYKSYRRSQTQELMKIVQEYETSQSWRRPIERVLGLLGGFVSPSIKDFRRLNYLVAQKVLSER